MHPALPSEDKENFNPEANCYSPRKLVNQKRYKVLKALTMRNRTMREEDLPLKEKVDCAENEIYKKEESTTMKMLEFKDETTRRFGI